MMTTGHNHEEKLQELIDATTDLTEEVAIGKKELDSAVSSAKEDAAIAQSSSQVATEKATEASKSAALATAKANESKQSADNAAKVVTGGTATLVPSAGKIPLANAKGEIDSNWIPLIQAMYPHSGVMGSVDKLDLFSFHHSNSGHSNKMWVKTNSDLRVNIAGRYIALNNAVITFEDAESTPERAVAFDDIFLDWNGVVTPYRSIIPHRTVTGYDSDAIATEHGYSKVSTGLYKIGDTYALLLGRVARRNKGAFHPVFNKEGCASLPGLSSAARSAWFKRDQFKPKSINNCFGTIGDLPADQLAEFTHNWNPTASIAYAGKIGTPSAHDNRPDKKYYDAIYADDFTPLYYSARSVIDREALLNDSFNKAVAGETFMGAEGTTYQRTLHCNEFVSSTPTIVVNRDTLQITNGGLNYGADVDLTVPTGAEIEYSFEISDISGGTVSFDLYDPAQLIIRTDKSGVYEGKYTATSAGNRVVFIARTQGVTATISNIRIKVSRTSHVSARPQFQMVDIIGSLDAMPENWFPDPDNYEATKDRHIPGNWLAVGENGESLIPDGTNKNYKASRKCLELYQALMTSDKGATWSDVTSTLKQPYESPSNARDSAVQANQVQILCYRTSANPFELSGLMVCDAIGNGFESNAAPNSERGVILGSNLFGKVVTNPIDPSYFSFLIESWTQHQTGSLDRGGSYPVEHRPTKLVMQDSPAFKVLPYLSGNYLCVAYNEMKFRDGKWGNPTRIFLAHNQSTYTDFNGDSCLVGNKKVKLPYHFDGEY